MSVVQFTGFEAGADFFGDVGFLAGTSSYVTSPVNSGTYALRTNPTTTATGYSPIFGLNANGTVGQGVFNINDTYVQFYFRAATLPASGYEQICVMSDAGAGYKGWLAINSAGKLSVYDKDFSKIGSDGTTTISTNTWYQIRFYLGNGTSAAFSVYINGLLELSGTGNFLAANCGSVYLGKFSDRSGQSVDYYFDDVIVDDAAFPTTDLKVGALKATANGSTMTWSAGTNTSDYTQVDEVPIDSTDYVQSPTSGNPNIALFTMQSTSAAGFNGNVKAIKGIAFSRENTSVTSAVKIRVKSGSTNSDSSTFNGNNSTYNGQSRLLLTDPDTSAAWTTSGVNAIEVGPVENNAVAQRCMAVLTMVLYEPIAAVTFSVSDTMSISEAITNLRTRLFNVSSSLSLSELATALKGLSFSVSDSIGLTDVWSGLRNRIISIADSLGLTDNAMIKKLWENDTKPSSSYTADTKQSSSYTNDSKPTTNWTNENK